MSTAVNYLPEVKEQYEDLPYPPRDPQNEKQYLICGYPDVPDRLNHYCYEGKQNFKDFQILVAGGGTGDATIFMAEQYGPLGAKITHLDLSTASINIAKERAKLRGIEEHIQFVHASLLDVEKLNLGMFDYINCTGVLHHLSNPNAGLKALTHVLKPDGVMTIMVYATYGRLAVYPMQHAFKIALKNVSSREEKIRIGREILNRLPPTNWYHFTAENARNEISSDSGFYDLLLHSQDRSYTVPEIYEFIESAGLKHLSFQHEATSGAFYYNPFRMIRERSAAAEFKKLSTPECQALAELLCGNTFKHQFYTSRVSLEEPNPEDETFVPTVNCLKKPIMKGITQAAIDAKDPMISYLDPAIGAPTHLTIQFTTAALMLAIDNKRTIAEIIHIMTSQTDFTHAQVKQEFLRLYYELRRDDILFLRHSSVPEFDDMETLQNKMELRMGY